MTSDGTRMTVASGTRDRAFDRRFWAFVGAGVVIALLFGPDGPLGVFWRPAEGSPEPSGALIPGFIVVAIAEGLALGAAIAVGALGRPWFRSLVGKSRFATVAWVSTMWLLGSWWPHTATHRFVGEDLGGLLLAEWIFHVGSMVAVAVVLAAIVTAATHPGARL